MAKRVQQKPRRRVGLKEMGRRGLSMLMAMIMVISLIQISAFAYAPNQVMDGYFTVNKDGQATKQDGTNDPVTQDGYTVSKTINQTGENAFDITLEVQTEQTVTTNDAAVVLVIDVSNSMSSEMWNLKYAAKKFVDSLVENNEGGKIHVSVVAFGSYAYKACDWIDITAEGSGWEKSGAEKVKDAIDGLEVNGGTNLEAGLMLARNRLKMADVAGASAKYTVLFTDGEPTYRVENESNDTNYAGTRQTGGNTSDGYWEGLHWNAGGSKCSEAERNEASDMADEVKQLSQLYTICYGVGEDILYGSDKCVNCQQPRSSHNRQYEGLWPFGEYHYYCRNSSGNEYQSSSVTMGQYLENEIATPAADGVTYAFDAEDSEQLNAAFADIASSVSEGSTGAGTKVVDPMGEFINFGQVKSVKGGTASTDASGRTLTWTLDPEDAETSTNGGKTTYTFTLTYSVTLDTAAQGFQETEEVDGKVVTKNYPTNGYTRLEVPGGEDVVFNVPGVFGEIPQVGYTINYWYYDRDQKKYVLGDSDTGRADLWSKVNVDPEGYSKANYEFDHGDKGEQTLEPGKLEFNLYYDPISVSVVVNHWVITKEQTDSGYTFTGPVKEGYQTYDQYCKGDKFTNEQFLEREGLTQLQEGQSQVVNDVTYTTDDYTDVELTDKQTIIDIYYINDGGDKRTPVDYVIQYWYRNNAWELVDGKYQVVEGEYFKGDVDYGTAKHGETIKFADKNDGYTLDQIEGSNGKDSFELTLDKAENPNVVNVYYSKDPVTAPEEATLTIVHKFYKLGINGPELVDTQYEMGSEDGGDEVYVGETYTAEDRTPSGFIRMTSDAGMTKEMVSGSNVIEVEYYRDTLEETHVSVYHYYRTWAWEVNAETGDGEYVLVKEDMKPGHPEGTFYVGQTYQAVPNPNGFELNEEESDLEARVLVQGDNTFQLYYDAYESKEEDEADVTINHIYRTYRSYVDDEGNVILKEPGLIKVESEDIYYGTKGETITAKKNEKDGFTFVSADTEDLKVTLKSKNGQYNLYYEYVDNQLGDKVPVTVQPVYKTYTRYINDNGEDVTELKSTENGAPVKLGQYYVGQNATALNSDYAKPGFTYDAADADNTKNLTVNVTGNGDVITVVYSRVEDNRGAPEVMLVNNVYTTRTTYIENGEVKTSETSFTGSTTTYPIYRNQFANVANLGTKLPGYELDSTKTQPSDRVQITEDGMQFTFYWVMEVDRTTPATVKVVHHYKIHDANPNVSDRIWTVGENDAPVAAYAFQDYLLPYAYDGQFKPSDVKDVQHNGVSISERNAVELTAGDNRIDIYYEKNEDSRVPSSVKVVHNYYKDADALVAGTTEASYEENISKIGENLVMEADTFTATLRLENGSMTYNFDSATPADYTITVNADAEKNVITINYVRAETTYTVVHEYYTNGEFTGKTEQHLGGKAGDVINAADITKVTSYGGETYTYSGASADSITLAADGSSTITLQYDRTTGGGGGDGTTYYNLVVKYLEEGTDEELAPSYTARIAAGRSYDVTAQTEKVIDGYEISQVTGDDVTGYMNGNREIIVYYTVDIDDGETPLDPGPGGDGDGTDIDDGEVPLDPGPGGDGDGTDIGDENVPLVPATGDNLALWVMAAVASAAGLVYLTVAGKKREKDNT